jgi:hypothetical protein
MPEVGPILSNTLNLKAASKPVTKISDEDRLKRKDKISVGAWSSKKPLYNFFMPVSQHVPKRRNFLIIISLLDNEYYI